ncbi:MAG: NYN domain-containing protein [Tepidiformaceae bacterium]
MAAKEPEVELPEPSSDAIDDAEAHKRPSRRGSRGGRGRGRTAGETAVDETNGVEEVAEEPAAVERPKRVSRARATKPTALDDETARAVAAQTPAVDEEAEPAPQARTPRQRTPRTKASAPAAEAEAKASSVDTGNLDHSTAAILRAIEQQGRQIEQLTRLQEDMARRGGSNGVAAAPPLRVGIFVDAANVELASDRLRARFDWKKILNMLTQDRQLVRAIAYSPVHDDPGVSIETQRFVEPFLDKGYKVVTKPLKRFADGSIKANVDIELALDVLEMCDRLDVVVLISGDGDFQRLVEVVQSKGIRVEVVAVGSSTASNLRHAADHFMDLQARLRDVRV